MEKKRAKQPERFGKGEIEGVAAPEAANNTVACTALVPTLTFGIPEAIQRKLFTPFFTTKDEGMGLGLSMCRTVVEQHGGFLGFESNRPQGTIFRFTLPVDPASPEHPA